MSESTTTRMSQIERLKLQLVEAEQKQRDKLLVRIEVQQRRLDAATERLDKAQEKLRYETEHLAFLKDELNAFDNPDKV